MDILTQKKCTKCGEWKDRGEFHKNKASKDGLVSSCKACVSNRLKEYYQDNTEAVKEKARNYRAANPQKIAEFFRKHYRANINKIKKYKHGWYQANRESHNQKSRQWRQENPEREKEIKRQWLDKHPGKLYEYTRTRRAHKKASGGRISLAEWQSLKEFYNNTCLRCRQKEPKIKLELDHVVPLSKGGLNTLSNAQCLCVSCNRSKGTKHIDYRPVVFYG